MLLVGSNKFAKKKQRVQKFLRLNHVLGVSKYVYNMFVIAVFHGPPDNVMMAALPESYNLPVATLQQLCKRMVAVPVTYEHAGIHEAMGSITDSMLASSYKPAVAKALNSQASPASDVLGTVLQAFEMDNGAFAAQFTVDVANRPLLNSLLTTGMLGNVSLTHVMVDNVAVPLELSLVHNPARPKSKILHIAHDANTSNLYKAQLVAGCTNPYAMPESPPVAQTCADALMMVPEPQRQIIAARMAELVKNADASKHETTELQQKLQDTQRHGQMDQQILEGQLKQVLEYLDPKVRGTYGFPDNIEDCMKMFDPSDATKMGHATLRTLMCCNQAMMTMQMKSASAAAAPAPAPTAAPVIAASAGAAALDDAAPGKKRAKVDAEEENTMEVEDVATVTPSGDSALARALFATFN